MWQANCNYKRNNTEKNAHYVKNEKTPQSLCWTLKKLTSSHLIKNTAMENGKR